MLYLFWESCALFFLFFLNAYFVVFRVNLTKLRLQAMDRSKYQEFQTYKSVTALINNANKIAQTLVLLQFFIAFAISLLCIFLNITLAVDFEMNVTYSWLRFALIFFLIIISYYGLEVLMLRVTSTSLNLIWLNRTAPLILLISKILFPFTWVVGYFISRICGVFKLSSQDDKISSFDTEFLLLQLEQTNGCFSTEILNIIRNAIRLPDLDVSDVLLPRSQIQYLDLDDTIQQNLEKARKTGHTRFPLCKGGMDHCLGIIHIKDIFQYQGDIEFFDFSKFQRQLIRFDETTPIEVALKKLQKFKIHMALVVDEFGGTIGVLTLEDILEELVGNIQDEFDHEDAKIIPITKNTYKVSGLTSIQELENFFNLKIDNDKVSTFGGLITATLGRIPEKNERIKLLCWSIRITEVSKQRIISTIVRDISSENSVL